MDILITESQNKLLITEGVGETLRKVYEHSADYSADLYKRVKNRLGVNTKILLTFGSLVGSLIEPAENYLSGKYPDLTEDQIILLVVGIVSVMFVESRELAKQMVNKIKQNDLELEFRDGLRKTKKLLNNFQKFLATGVSTAAFASDVISYVYMIPLLGYLTMFIQGQGLSETEITDLVTRLSMIGVFHVSTEVLRDIVKRITK